jgi:hypothetical protein
MISVVCGLILACAAYFIMPNLMLALIVGLAGIDWLLVIGLVLSTVT